MMEEVWEDHGKWVFPLDRIDNHLLSYKMIRLCSSKIVIAIEYLFSKFWTNC